MRYQKFEALISQPRLARYKAACANDTRKTVRLYRANIRISQAFLAVLGIFEIVLRNKIDTHYKAQFPAVVAAGGHEWLFGSTLPGGFLTAPNCRNSRQKITDTYTSLGVAYTHDKLLSELSFGFWKFLFSGHQFMAGGNTLLAIFPNLPAGYNQNDVYQKLNKINAIRNRVAHHEPICFAIGNTIGTNYARDHFQHVTDVLQWMNITASELFYGVDGILKEADYIDNI